MVGVIGSLYIRVAAAALVVVGMSGCVSTEALYAQYDAADCNIVATKDEAGAISLHEQNTDTHYPWEPAVYFAFDSSELAEEERARLDKSMQVLKQFPALIVGVQGFTDTKGTVQYNKALAERRVLAVSAYLQGNGIASNRVVLQPIGEQLPLIDSEVRAERRVSRRVELMLLDDEGRPMQVLYAMGQP